MNILRGFSEKKRTLLSTDLLITDLTYFRVQSPTHLSHRTFGNFNTDTQHSYISYFYLLSCDLYSSHPRISFL